MEKAALEKRMTNEISCLVNTQTFSFIITGFIHTDPHRNSSTSQNKYFLTISFRFLSITLKIIQRFIENVLYYKHLIDEMVFCSNKILIIVTVFINKTNCEVRIVIAIQEIRIVNCELRSYESRIAIHETRMAIHETQNANYELRNKPYKPIEFLWTCELRTAGL